MIDYEYSLALSETRTGSVECPFNPYVIPGYPMDLVEPDTNTPSIHAFCVSVSHSITPQSIGTSISFTSAMTYDELRAYELPSILPWFREKFGMLNKLSLIDQTEEVKNLAGEYYLNAIGVGFADPTILEDEDTGAANSVYIDPNTGSFNLDYTDVFQTSGLDSWSSKNSLLTTSNPNLTYEGSLNLVRREIETMAEIEKFSGINFIDIQDRLSLSPQERRFIKGTYRNVLLKPGRSPFLDYSAQEAALQKEADKMKTPKPSKAATQKSENGTND